MSKRLLTTRMFSVDHRVYTAPDGETVERDVIVHPGAVVILPILDDGRIVLIRNHRYAGKLLLAARVTRTRSEPRP